jgi:hypothetical protein
MDGGASVACSAFTTNTASDEGAGPMNRMHHKCATHPTRT